MLYPFLKEEMDMKKNKIGIIQGRLSPRPYPKLQEFPHKTWREEFKIAREIGYDFIEWIFEENCYQENPIWTVDGREDIKRCIEETGVTVESVCADFFLDNPFFRRTDYSFEELVAKMKRLISYSSEIGAGVILLPVLENAEIRTEKEADILIKALNQLVDTLEHYSVRIGLETELAATQYFKLASRIKNEHIGIYYDTGNCAFRGYDMRNDMEILLPKLLQVHVKDRLVGGGSVFLGIGDTNFSEGIPYIQRHGYNGNYVLQTYFEEDYLETASKNLEYIRRLL